MVQVLSTSMCFICGADPLSRSKCVPDKFFPLPAAFFTPEINNILLVLLYFWHSQRDLNLRLIAGSVKLNFRHAVNHLNPAQASRDIRSTHMALASFITKRKVEGMLLTFIDIAIQLGSLPDLSEGR